jgi:hypothetical protein
MKSLGDYMMQWRAMPLRVIPIGRRFPPSWSSSTPVSFVVALIPTAGLSIDTRGDQSSPLGPNSNPLPRAGSTQGRPRTASFHAIVPQLIHPMVATQNHQ